MDKTKRETLITALETTSSVEEAAKQLNVSKQWVYKLIKKYRLKTPD